MMATKTRIEQVRRFVPTKGLDFYPTPPWATRALFRHVIGPVAGRVWEPACGNGMMAEVIKEFTESGSLHASDVYDYGYGTTENFLTSRPSEKFEWIITNPPFNAALAFAEAALERASNVALLVRLQFLEGKKRYEFFQRNPPRVAVFSERLGFNPGLWDPTRDRGVTAFAWFVWMPWLKHGARLSWIPPGCRELTLPRDEAWMTRGRES